MSTSIEAQRDFAKMVLNHSALDGVIERVHLKLFQKFRKGTDEERQIIADILDAGDLFIREIRAIDAEATEIDNT